MAQIKLGSDDLIDSTEIDSVKFWGKGTSAQGDIPPPENDRLCILMKDASHRLVEGPEIPRVRAELENTGIAVTTNS
jgi:hypothetical protein